MIQTPGIETVGRRDGLTLIELQVGYGPGEGISVDALVASVRGLYALHGQDNPWENRSDAEWGWALRDQTSGHYAVVGSVGDVAQPEEWQAYARVGWRGDFGVPRRTRIFEHMIHQPTPDGRRAAQALLAIDASSHTRSWTGSGGTYEQRVVLDVPDLSSTLAGKGYEIRKIGERGRQFASKRISVDN